jgi:hypothetical protein
MPTYPRVLQQARTVDPSSTYAGKIGSRLRRAAAAASGRSSLERPLHPLAPAVSTSSSNLDASLTKTVYFTVSAAQAASFAIRGSATPLVSSSIYWIFPTVTLPTGTGNVDATHDAAGWAVEFMCDAPRAIVFAKNSTSAFGLLFEVDGQATQGTGLAFPASSGGSYWLLDFTVGTVAFTDSGDLVTVTPLSGQTGHGLKIGDQVMFGAITSTTGVSANVTYYVSTVPTATTLTLSATPGGSTLALTTDGTSTGISVARVRRIRVEGDRASGMRGVHVGPAYSVWKPLDTDPITAVMVGDSNVAQIGVTKPNGGWPIGMAKLLGWSSIREIGIGGTGWVNPGTSASTFGDATRIADAVSANPDVVCLTLSTNDNASSAPVITAAVLAGLQAYRAAFPTAPIILFGCQPGAGGPAAATLANEAAGKAAWVAFGDSNSWFIDVSGDAQGAWISGTGHVGATNASGNSDRYVGSADTIHMSQEGHDYVARRGADAVRQLVLPTVPA